MARIASLLALAATPALAQRTSVAPAADARVQGGSPDVNFGDDATLWLGNPDKTAFLYFDLSGVPAGATIDAAELVLTFVSDNGQGPNPIDIGAVTSRWGEGTVTYANQPAVTWSGRRQTVSGNGAVTWEVKPLVDAWIAAGHRNHGLALRGDGPLKAARSRESAVAGERPALRISYTPASTGGPPTLDSQVETALLPVPYPGTVDYQVRLRHNGTQTVPAEIQEELPYPLHLLPQVNGGSTSYVVVGGTAGGSASVDFKTNGGLATQLVKWSGTMAPGSTVTLDFQVHVHPYCQASASSVTVDRVIRARSGSHAPVSDRDSYRAACPGYSGPFIDTDPIAAPVDPSQAVTIRLRNRHNVPVILGLFKPGTAPSAPLARRVKIPAGKLIDMTDVLVSSLTKGGKLGFCFLFDEDQPRCPDPAAAPGLFGELQAIKP
ncbi:MAG: DNRLRE domain-containing protein [Gemmatimonadales bacterium]